MSLNHDIYSLCVIVKSDQEGKYQSGGVKMRLDLCRLIICGSSCSSSCILLRSGNLFVVQWDKVRLKDREAEGPFTFQAALHRNGTIVFNYREVSRVVYRVVFFIILSVHFKARGNYSEVACQVWPSVVFRSPYRWRKWIQPSIQWKWDCLMLSWRTSRLHSPQVSSPKEVSWLLRPLKDWFS